MKKANDIRHTSSYIITTIISRVFDPFVVFAGVIGWLIWESSLVLQEKYLFLAIVFGVMIIPPAALLAWAVETKRISNWDISNREERPLALFVVFMLGFVNILIVQAFGDASLIHIFTVLQLWMAGFFVITLAWKISGHTGVLTLAVGILIMKLGVEYWYFALPVFVVAVARVIRKNHTPAQVIVGALYSWGVLLFARSVGLL